MRIPERQIMITIKIDETKLTGAIGVLENYLDGAVVDYENGQIDEENSLCIKDSIYVRKILTIASTHGFSSLIPDEYEERYNKANERKQL